MMVRYLAPACLVLMTSSVIAFAAPFIVSQKHRAFSLRELHVAAGDTVHFSNEDEFLHQVYVESPAFRFASDEQAPGQSVDIKFPVRGTFEVRCQIHPKMKLLVTVE